MYLHKFQMANWIFYSRPTSMHYWIRQMYLLWPVYSFLKVSLLLKSKFTHRCQNVDWIATNLAIALADFCRVEAQRSVLMLHMPPNQTSDAHMLLTRLLYHPISSRFVIPYLPHCHLCTYLFSVQYLTMRLTHQALNPKHVTPLSL